MNNNLKKFLPINLDKFGFVEREKINNKIVKNRCGRDFLYYSLNYYYPNKFNSNKCNPVQIEKQKIFGLPLPSWLVWTCLPFYKIPKLFRDNNLVLYINDIKIDSFIKFVRVIMFPPKLSFTDCLNKIINSVNDGLRFWNFVSYTIFVFPLLLLSLLTYKMHDEIFVAWMSFAKWWVPLSLVVTIFIPSSSGGMIPVAFKLIFSVICSIILFVVSLCVVGWRYNVLKKSRE
jgi:hypothetical protein